MCLQDLESLLISDSSPKLFFSPEEVLVADGDSWEVDTLGVDNFHIHSPGVASQVDESLTHEPQEETAGQEHSYGPQHPARRHTMPCKTAHRLKQWNYPARKRTMDMFKHQALVIFEVDGRKNNRRVLPCLTNRAMEQNLP